MKNFVAAVLVSAACTPYPNLNLGLGPMRMDTMLERNPVAREKHSSPGTMISSMLLFPEGYDWVRDTAYGAKGPALALFEGTKRKLLLDELPETDMDMHRLRDGRLYSNYSTDEETIVLAEGDEIFRFKGRESFSGFLVRKDGIHTLGRNRSGGGFVYRIDGREKLSRLSGTLLGGFQEDGGRLWFAFRARDEDSGKTLFYISDGTSCNEVADALKLDKVLEIRVSNGKAIVTGSMESSKRNPLVSIDGNIVQLGSRNPPGEAVSCSLVSSSGDMLFKGSYRTADGGEIFVIWNLKGPLETFPVGDVLAAILPEGKKYISIRHSGGRLILRDLNGVDSDLGPYRLMAPSCIAVKDGKPLLAMSSEGGCCLWFDGKYYRIPGNGFLTGVDILGE